MTILFTPYLLPDGNEKRRSYLASIEQPSQLQGRTIFSNDQGSYEIGCNNQVLFLGEKGSPPTKFHVQDGEAFAQIVLERLNGASGRKKWNFAIGDNFIKDLGVFRWQPGNREIER